MNVDLPDPDEPVSLKTDIQTQLPQDEPVNWDLESFAVWYGNRIQSYLWDEWKSILKPLGFDWQTFLKLMSLCTNSFTLWIADEKEWSEVVDDIERRLSEWGPLLLASQ